MLISVQIPDDLVTEIDTYAKELLPHKGPKFSTEVAAGAVEQLKAQTNQRSFDIIKTGILMGLAARAKPVPQKTNRTAMINAMLEFAAREMKNEKEHTLEQVLEIIEDVPRPVKLK